MKVINFKIDHLDLIAFKHNKICKDILESFTLENAKSFIVDNRVVFVWGLEMIRKGVGHCWSIPTIYTQKNKILIHKKTSLFIQKYTRKLNIHRLQTTIDNNHVKWIESLGFERESVLKKITTDKKDEYLYTKFFNNGN